MAGDQAQVYHTGLDDQVAHVGWRRERTPITSITKVHFRPNFAGPSPEFTLSSSACAQESSHVHHIGRGVVEGGERNSHGQGTRRTWVLNT